MSQAFNHTAVTGQNVFYVNSVSGSNTWTGRFPWHKPNLITGDDIVSGGEGPFKTISSAVSHTQIGNDGDPFFSSVVIVMSDGGASGEGRTTGDSGLNWNYQSGHCEDSIVINEVSGHNVLIIGGNTGGVIDGTIATIERVPGGLCGVLPASLKEMASIFSDGSSWMNLDFYSTGDGLSNASAMFNISGNHTNIINCNFIDNGVSIIGNNNSSVNLSSCSFINCGTTGSPAVTINNINLYSTEFNSTINPVTIQLTGTSSIANIYSSSFINCGTAIDYKGGRCSIMDSVFVSGTGVDVDSSYGAMRRHLISVDNLHYDAITAYQCVGATDARYIIAPLFGNGKFNHPGNSLTTGGNTTTGNYTVTGQTHNIMERYANAYRTSAASKLTANNDGYYASLFDITSTNIVPSIVGNAGRSGVLHGNSVYINERTPESKPENSTNNRGQVLYNQRAISINSRGYNGTADRGVGTDCTVEMCRDFDCLDLMCCCADTPLADCKCGYKAGEGHHEDKAGLLGLENYRDGGYCCLIDKTHEAHRAGDSCCTDGISGGGGSVGLSISVF